MSKFQNSKMFRRIDSMAKKIAEKSKSRKQEQSTSHSTNHSIHQTEDSAAYNDESEIDLSMLIGPNKGKTAAQIIDELDPRYFQSDPDQATDPDHPSPNQFDPLREILESLPVVQSQAADDALEAKLNELDVVKLLIDKRLSNAVFANYTQFVSGLSLIGDIKDDLFESSLSASEARSRLAEVRQELTLRIFSTLQQSQRTARLNTVQVHITDIALLLRREKEIAILLKDNEFMNAVQVYKDSLTRLAQSGMNRFTALDDLRKRFLRSGESIHARARDQLQSLCKKYDQEACSNVMEALVSLGETKVVAEVVRKSFPQAIEDTSISSILPYLNHELIANNASIDMTDLRKVAFKDLVPMIDMTRFAALFLTVVSNFADILSSCSRMFDYFNELVNQHEENHSLVSSLTQARDVLTVHKADLWSSVQGHLTTLLSSVHLSPSSLKIDDFLRVLHAGFEFLNLGESFSHLNSDGLKGVLFRKAKDYVKIFTRESFDSVKSQLEREQWNALRTSAKFSLSDLPELASRGDSSKPAEEHSNFDDPVESLDSIEPSDVLAGAQYESFLRGENPFRPQLEEQLRLYDFRLEEKSREKERGKHYKLMDGAITKPLLTSKLLDVKTQELLRKAALFTESSIDPDQETTQSNLLVPPVIHDEGVILTASSLATIKSIGRYLSITEAIKPLAGESISNIEDLASMYLYTTFTQFGHEQAEFFTEWFDKYPALKKIVCDVKSRVESGAFGSGTFSQFATPKPVAAESKTLEPSPTSNSSSFTSSKDQSHNQSTPTSSSKFGNLGNLGNLKNIGGRLNASLANVTNRDKDRDRDRDREDRQERHKPEPVVHHVREEKRAHPVLVPLNSKVHLDNEQTMFALRERCVAAESMVPVVNVLEACAPRLYSWLKPSQVTKLKEFIQLLKRACEEFNSYIYRNLSPLLLPKDVFASKVVNVDWMMSEPPTRASPYVFSILTALRANDLTIKSAGGLPYTIERHLYSEVSLWLSESLVDSLSKVKRCTPTGRGAMMLDATVLHDSMLRLLRLESMPHWKNVNDYIHAYFLSADEWISWLPRHPNFDLMVVIACVQCGAGANLDRAELKQLQLRISREWQRVHERTPEEREEEEKQIAREDAEKEMKQKAQVDTQTEPANDIIKEETESKTVENEPSVETVA